MDDKDLKNRGSKPLVFLGELEDDLAYKDARTGLYNYRLLMMVFDRYWSELVSDYDKLALIMLDLDGFKKVNDSYGHLTGDKVLLDTAHLLKGHFRSDDLVVRYGGDEFVVVLPGAGVSQASLLAERAREAMDNHPFQGKESEQPVEISVSFSLGMASFPEDGRTGSELLNKADQRLYEEKSRRRPPEEPLKKRQQVRPAFWVALVVALVSSLSFLLWRAEHRTSEPSNVTAREHVEVIDTLWTVREAEMMAQIEGLQKQLAELRAQQEARGTPDSENYQQASVLLNDEVIRLQEKLTQQLQAAAEEEAEPVLVMAEIITTDPDPEVHTDERDAQPEPTPDLIQETDTNLSDAAKPLAVEVQPELRYFTQPQYPLLARKLKQEATVLFRVIVDSSGRVTQVDPIGEPAGFGFDKAARQAALSAVYSPGTRNGVPVTKDTSLLIRFVIDK